MRKEIIYMGETIIVDTDGTIIWNNKVRKHNLNHDGYPVVSINTQNGWRCIGIARLIATAFIPNPQELSDVDHINYDRTDYSIENLRWISHADNVKRSVCNLPDRHGENNPNYGNTKLSQFYAANPDIAREKQGRPGTQNGRYKHGRYVSEKV